jgi:hypothetical protein
VFKCTVIDVRSKRVIARDTFAGGTGSYQALGGVSSMGEEPWEPVEHWVSTLVVP